MAAKMMSSIVSEISSHLIVEVKNRGHLWRQSFTIGVPDGELEQVRPLRDDLLAETADLGGIRMQEGGADVGAPGDPDDEPLPAERADHVRAPALPTGVCGGQDALALVVEEVDDLGPHHPVQCGRPRALAAGVARICGQPAAGWQR